MNQASERDHATFAVEGPRQGEVDDALRTYPLSPAPPTLVPAVLTRIHALRPTSPRFQLAWMDYAVSLFVTGMVALAFVLWQSITPQTMLRARLQILLWQQLPDASLLWASLLGGLLLTAVAFLVAVIVFARRPQSVPR
jgi:hypothetical protein